MPAKILVVGDDTRSFLAVVRSFGRAGHEVHAAPFDWSSAALSSRYLTATHWLPFYMGDGTAWLEALRALVDRQAIDFVLPCDERALLPLHAHRDAFFDVTLALPSPRAIDVFYDKHHTRELAAEEGVAVAPGRLLRADDTAEGIAAELGLPVALKPRRSYRLEVLHARGKVVLAEDLKALRSALAAFPPEETVLEAFAPGVGGGVSLLAAEGEVLQAFEHHRVHDDLAVGGSYYRRSAPLTPVLLAAVERLVAAIGYTGVGMFEFRIDTPNGRYALLEINARPWGSMPLPLALGVDFPERWRRLLTTGERTAPVRYRSGVYGRNLVPDLKHMVLDLQRARGRPLGAARILAGRALALLRLPAGREHFDTLVRDDPKPAFAELAELRRTAEAKLGTRLPGAAARRRRRVRRLLASLGRAASPAHLVFTCHGNICRSPFAAALAARQLDAASCRISSAGILPVVDRPSPPEAVTVAREHGVDLAPHRSRHLDPELAAADVLVVFDDKNVASITQRYPEAAPRIVKLEWLLDGDADIDDPYGRGPEAFRLAYARIAQALSRLTEFCGDLPRYR